MLPKLVQNICEQARKIKLIIFFSRNQRHNKPNRPPFLLLAHLLSLWFKPVLHLFRLRIASIHGEVAQAMLLEYPTSLFRGIQPPLLQLVLGL